MNIQTCPTCGSQVKVNSADEGTQSYQPVVIDLVEVEKLVQDFAIFTNIKSYNNRDVEELQSLRQRIGYTLADLPKESEGGK